MPKYFLFLVALIWTGIVSYFCLVNSNEIPVINIPNLDKCIHTFFHLVFTFVWFLFFRKQLQSDNAIKPLMYSFVFSFVFGIAIEMLQQSITTTRHADILDVVANSIGAILAVFTVLICNKFNILNSILKK
ncbi:VanZ family protein [Flavobacterium sp. 103]|uniref:VanZ family protein n=1 Tax=Flavobacterium sp. 103 TaxID=2135624 RepID=UPI000E313114|nr:VanZ family protein [Flavobacterium sp. 103]